MPSYDRQEFFRLVSKLPEFVPLQLKLGPGIAPNLIGIWFDEALRFADGKGDWNPAMARVVVVDARSKIKVKSGDHDAFVSQMRNLCTMEDYTIANRERHVAGLLAKAVSGALRAELERNLEPPGNYFHGPAPEARAQWHQVGHMKYERVLPSQRDKALAWLTRGVAGDGGAFGNVLDRYVTNDGKMPLDEGKVREIWKTITKGSAMPRYRTTLIGPQLYPSEVGGAYLLKKVFRLLAGATFPPRGNPKWEDWALFCFGSVMAVQGFTDGNKRTARAAYAILMVSAGIEFRAPTNDLGSRLAKMTA